VGGRGEKVRGTRCWRRAIGRSQQAGRWLAAGTSEHAARCSMGGRTPRHASQRNGRVKPVGASKGCWRAGCRNRREFFFRRREQQLRRLRLDGREDGVCSDGRPSPHCASIGLCSKHTATAGGRCAGRVTLSVPALGGASARGSHGAGKRNKCQSDCHEPIRPSGPHPATDVPAILAREKVPCTMY